MPLADVDRFGLVVATLANRHWRDHGTGPTWREVLQNNTIRETVSALSADSGRDVMRVLMRRAAGRGWIVSHLQARSLCAGPRYFARRAGATAHGLSETLGRPIAQAIGTFRYRHHRSPLLEELAREVRSANGPQSLRSKKSIRDQLPWLTATGWIRFEGAEIRRGPTAKVERLQRAEAKRRQRTTPSNSGDTERPRADAGRPM